jgi:heat shock protein HslJ
MKKSTILGVLALAGIGLILLKFGMSAPQAVSLSGTAWLLTTLNNQALASGTTITLSIEDGKISGSDGCNRYGASLALSASQWVLGKDVVTTKMACAGPVMQQGAAYLGVLAQAVSYQSDGAQLTLLDAGGKPLAAFSAQNTRLGGSSWIVTGYNNGKQAVVSVLNGTQLTADFSADGTKLSGSAGCNQYAAVIELTGKNIKIDPLVSTRTLCTEPAGRMEQETQYLKALETAAVYRIEANQLELRSADGALAASFEKAP